MNQGDWILKKPYLELPLGSPGSPVGGIPADIENILFLLRLYKVGDISFVRLAIILPSGRTHVQLPYRAMNDLNSYSGLRFKIESADDGPWKAFATGIRDSQSWSSDWFAVARRFFLCGGAKQLNPKWDDVDRIVDYATALESTLVPEADFSTRRLSRRAAALVAPDDPVEGEEIVRFIKKLYELRSRIVHGSRLGDETRQWLTKNCDQVERRVRQVLVAAVERLPPEEGDRHKALIALYDLTDEDRGISVFEKFREIKTTKVRSEVAAKIAGEMEKRS